MSDDVKVFHLDDGQGTSLAVGEIGAAWLSCRVPVGDRTSREVLLAPPSAADAGTEPGYLGVVVGRYANRIGGAAFEQDGCRVQLQPNEGLNQLHGGPGGFDKQRWTLQHHGERELRLGLTSPDGDQGYPGRLEASVTYAIDGPGRIRLRFEATVDRPCPVNLTSHAYFNLDGAPGFIGGHRFGIAASHVLPVDAGLIPTGAWDAVSGTAFELDGRTPLGERRFDHCFILAEGADPQAEVVSGDGRLRLTLRTSYPALQFYTGQYLHVSRGRDGQPYRAGDGFALEPQFLPDAPNHPEWPARCRGLLQPGQRLDETLTLDFTAL